MKSEDLIEALAHDVGPVRRRALSLRLTMGLIMGAVATAAAVGLVLGFRPDLWIAMQGTIFWIKWLYTGSLAICASLATVKLARPDSGSFGWLWIALLPVLCLALLSTLELASTPSSQWLAMWLGGSWKVCSRNVVLLSVPIFGGLLWSFRRLAPTRLRTAGAAAGLTAGAWAATLYCLHCPETSLIFVLTWYTLGMALAALAGAALGPRLLRW
ncbi:hypothetical protein J3E64_000708 [Sphingobium sp. OAS761]|uniref:DUF1109 domain-containing protein n=1 Tax=Sphingobium sp. OAS761 TaxID=2817901 RepID=UPI00209F3364|nr:DUF1109 domain-containing protein [Sphingobium sp. OAS761]MCP1469037.1 hypothetical protein [Sphingobium sp. OAS761]